MTEHCYDCGWKIEHGKPVETDEGIYCRGCAKDRHFERQIRRELGKLQSKYELRNKTLGLILDKIHEDLKHGTGEVNPQ